MSDATSGYCISELVVGAGGCVRDQSIITEHVAGIRDRRGDNYSGGRRSVEVVAERKRSTADERAGQTPRCQHSEALRQR